MMRNSALTSAGMLSNQRETMLVIAASALSKPSSRSLRGGSGERDMGFYLTAGLGQT
jgi:hypothetical protein